MENNTDGLVKGNIVYYAREIPGVWDILSLKIHNINTEMNYFTGTDSKTKHMFLFDMKNFNRVVFTERSDAVIYIEKKEQEYKSSHKNKIVEEDDVSFDKYD